METDLYTMKHLSGQEKYRIEDFISHNIESKYPKVYQLLVVEKKSHISAEERILIRLTTLSMYFRTPKVLNQFVVFASKIIKDTVNDIDSDTIDFLGYQISIKDKSFNKIRKEIKEKHRIDYIRTQLALLNQFINFKMSDGLVVIELVGDQEFITSDNPVEINNSFQLGFNLFDPGNMIYIPLDPKHALFVAPRKAKSIINQVFYRRDNLFQHVILNHCVYENAERWVLGTNTGIEKFKKDEEEFSKRAREDHPIIRKIKAKQELMETLANLAEKGISNDNLELVDFLKKLKQQKIFFEIIEFQDAYEEMKKMGLQI